MRIARESKFVRRECRKITPIEFFDLCMFSNPEMKETTLNTLTSTFEMDTEKYLSNQSLNERFNERSVEFMRYLLKHFLEEIISEEKNKYSIELECFETVKIKDSTCFKISDDLKSIYNSSNKADCKLSIIRIQFEYDLKTGQICYIDIQASAKQDNTDAQLTVDNVKEKDLIIRDLGYCVLSVLSKIDEKKSYFLSRFNFKSIAYETKDSEIGIDFNKIISDLKKNNLQCIEKNVFVGRKERLPVRLIIEVLPEIQISNRLQNLRKNAKRKGVKLSKEIISRASLNVYITNVSQDLLPINKVRNLYSLRWQIEIVFKAWKSIGKINSTKKVKIERFETMFYSRLILIIINWLLFSQIRNYLYHFEKKYLSVLKSFKIQFEMILDFKIALKQGVSSLSKTIQKLIDIICKKCIISKKKGVKNSYIIMEMFKNSVKETA
jgi:hypothetical protein